jgi:hypothetical protein
VSLPRGPKSHHGEIGKAPLAICGRLFPSHAHTTDARFKRPYGLTILKFMQIPEGPVNQFVGRRRSSIAGAKTSTLENSQSAGKPGLGKSQCLPDHDFGHHRLSPSFGGRNDFLFSGDSLVPVGPILQFPSLPEFAASNDRG